MVMNGRSQTSSADARYKFAGKERDAEINYDYLGHRYYDYRIGRLLSVDRFADKFPSLSPYSYAANNPISNIDINGDSILVRNMQPDLQYRIVSSVSQSAGVPLYISESGMLAETPTFTFNGETTHLASAYGTPADGSGSSEAKSFLNYAMSNGTIVNVVGMSSIGSQAGGQLIRLNPEQIQSFISGTPSELSKETMGYGIVFLHELVHTDIGKAYFRSPAPIVDPITAHGTGTVVDFINEIRRQLGPSYGQRTNYEALPFYNELHYIEFNSIKGSSKIIF